MSSLPKITLYELPEFKGAHRTFEAADDDLRDNNLNDKTSSLKVDRGIWLLYEHIEFGGNMYVVLQGHDYPNIQCWGAKKKEISSFRPVDTDISKTPSITIYDGPGCHGGRLELKEDMKDLSVQYFDNKVMSVMVNSGTWIGYEGIDFTGRQWLFTAGQQDSIAAFGGYFSRKMKSIKAIR